MTPNHVERPKGSFENITVSFRYILPILMVAFMYNYTQDQNRLNGEMAEIKDTGKQIWSVMAEGQKKVACINQNVAKCCPNAVDCY